VNRRVTWAAGALAVVLIPAFTSAQEAPPALEFSFSNPGARSMGLAGAFVALADDATAAFANPAGLVQLLRPEVSLELRRRNYSTPYTEGGRAVGAPTGYGIDTVNGVRTAFSNETTSGLSFLSFVYPGARWSLAVYRQQLADFSISTEINGLFGDLPEEETRRYEDQWTDTELDIVGTGISGAFRVSERLSLGFGLSYFSGTVDNRGSTHAVDVYPDTFWDRNSYLPERMWEAGTFTVDDTDVGLNFGVLWKFAEGWRFGGVYREGPRFDYELFNFAGPLHPLPEGSIIGSVTDSSIAFPDVWGFGLAYRTPSGNLTVGFEWDRVEYSVIRETLHSEQVDTTDVALDDTNELRLGAEYVVLKTKPLFALRGGIWYEPDHRFQYVGTDPFSRALYQSGNDALHLTIGAGIAFRHFQVDIGADFSDSVDQFALSGIFSF
jgi:long-subunit fatty acid transport protein